MTTTVEYLVFAGLAIGALVRLLKTDKMTRMLADLGLPPIPRRALPWISGALGLLSGALATWGHQAVIESGRRGVELGAPVAPHGREEGDGPAIGGP